MENEKPEAPLAATGTEVHNTDRLQQLQELYIRNLDLIRDAALSDKRLLFTDGENIIKAVAEHLHLYDGPLEDEPFQEWISQDIRRAAERYACFNTVLQEHEGVIHRAIWDTLGTNAKYFDEQAIFQEVALLFFLRLEFVLQKGRAKLSTRLYALARKHTLDYHIKKRNWRLEAVRQRLAQGRTLDCPEVLSELELAAMAAQES